MSNSKKGSKKNLTANVAESQEEKTNSNKKEKKCMKRINLNN